MSPFRVLPLTQAILAACAVLTVPQIADANPDVPLPTGQYITPLEPDSAVQQLLNPGLSAYPNFVAGGAVTARLSPDGSTLAILCAGQNTLYKENGSVDSANSTQYLFLYDVADANKHQPKLIQVIKQTNAHVGLVWMPDGKTLYAAGGNDDAVYAYTKSGETWAQSAKISLGHGGKGVGLNVQPNAGGLAISPDGKTLVVANNYNDSISVIDTATNKLRYEHDLRPYFSGNEGDGGKPGGTYPFAVAVKSVNVNKGEQDRTIAYVSANRDREVDVIDISSPTAGQLITRIKLDGNPLGMILDASQKTLYVAQDNTDQVAVIDTKTNTVTDKIDTRAPTGTLRPVESPRSQAGLTQTGSDNRGVGSDKARFTGASPIAVTLSPDGNTLYAVNDGANSIAVIPLSGGQAGKVSGLIPTAYAPKDITFSKDGSWMYIINGKSQTGPNTGHLFGNTASLRSSQYEGGIIRDNQGQPVAPVPTADYPLGGGCDSNCQADNAKAAQNAKATNHYQFQLEKSSLVSAPVPSRNELVRLTQQVSRNNFYANDPDPYDVKVMNFLQSKIKHVIYIVKENRTFDQVLGDLGNGADAEPALTVFGDAITPNQHKLAREFVTLDNFMDPGDGSMDGWSWATRGRVTSTEAITQQINYAGVNRGLSYESEGSNRNVPVNWQTVAQRDAVAGPTGTTNYTTAVEAANLPGGVDNLLAGARNHTSTDAPFGEEKGHIFNAVLAAGGTVRNYGFLVNNFGNRVADPYNAGEIQVGSLDPSLPRSDFSNAGSTLPAGSTDVYFRGYDQVYPDLWRYNEWKREFDLYVKNGKLPSLTLFRVSHDHMGSFSSALASVNTPETQQADNDLAVGLLVEAVAKSPYAKDTLIIVTEDDCQDGPDHVDSHRTIVFVAGPYVKKGGQVVNTRYSQVNALRTIEDILGTQHINLNTATQSPMAEVFDITAPSDWSYTAVASTVLTTTNLDLGETAVAKGPAVVPKHDADYWAEVTKGFNFAQADQVPPAQFNRLLWEGLKGEQPYPEIHSRWASVKDDDGDDD